MRLFHRDVAVCASRRNRFSSASSSVSFFPSSSLLLRTEISKVALPLLLKMPCLTDTDSVEESTIVASTVNVRHMAMCSTPLRENGSADDDMLANFDTDRSDAIDSFDDSYCKIQWELEKINVLRLKRKLYFQSISNWFRKNSECRCKSLVNSEIVNSTPNATSTVLYSRLL